MQPEQARFRKSKSANRAKPGRSSVAKTHLDPALTAAAVAVPFKTVDSRTLPLETLLMALASAAAVVVIVVVLDILPPSTMANLDVVVTRIARLSRPAAAMALPPRQTSLPILNPSKTFNPNQVIAKSLMKSRRSSKLGSLSASDRSRSIERCRRRRRRSMRRRRGAPDREERDRRRGGVDD